MVNSWSQICHTLMRAEDGWWKNNDDDEEDVTMEEEDYQSDGSYDYETAPQV